MTSTEVGRNLSRESDETVLVAFEGAVNIGSIGRWLSMTGGSCNRSILKGGLTITIGIDNPCERRRQHDVGRDDRRNGQAKRQDSQVSPGVWNRVQPMSMSCEVSGETTPANVIEAS